MLEPMTLHPRLPAALLCASAAAATLTGASCSSRSLPEYCDCVETGADEGEAPSFAECPDHAEVELRWQVAGALDGPEAELVTRPCVTTKAEVEDGSFRLRLDCGAGPDDPRVRIDAPDDAFVIVAPEQEVRFAGRREPGSCQAGDSFVLYHDAGGQDGALLVAGLAVHETELELAIEGSESMHLRYVLEDPDVPGEPGCRRLEIEWQGLTTRVAARSSTTLMDIERYRVDVGPLRPQLDDEACGDEPLFEVLITRL